MKTRFTVMCLAVASSCIPAVNENVPQAPHASTDSGWVEQGQDAPTIQNDKRFAKAPGSAAAENPAPAPDSDRANAESSVSPPPARPEALGRRDSGSPPSKSGSLDVESRSAPAEYDAAPRGGTAGEGAGALAESRSRRAVQPQPDDRPGLGTSWGEARESRVTEVAFERDGSRPSYTASLHYNDQSGAYAMAGRDVVTHHTQASIGLGGALTMSLRDEWGNNLTAYRGNGRTVAVGAHGQRYTIVVRNNTNERFEVVLSVDGLDVLDGREAGYTKRGYLIEAFGTIEVDGFRQSEDLVAAFRFGSVGQSYAAQTGSARNVGVIGAAAFGERGYSARLRAYQDRVLALRMSGVEVERRVHADPFPQGYAVPPMQLAR